MLTFISKQDIYLYFMQSCAVVSKGHNVHVITVKWT